MVSEESFKEGMARWASGVTVVTTWDVEPHGFTVSAFSSLSLNPRLCLVCATSGSFTGDRVLKTRRFAANVLASGQEELAYRFASRRTSADRFKGVDYEVGVTGSPLLEGALANIDCDLVAHYPGGDHVIMVGAIRHIASRDLPPLVYFRGQPGIFMQRTAPVLI